MDGTASHREFRDFAFDAEHAEQRRTELLQVSMGLKNH